MESSAIARYIPQKSKKRVFPGGSSSCAEPDVIEIVPPLADQSSKMKAKGKQKEVAYHEIIDVDMDEDRNDVVFLEGKVESNKKIKGSMGISLGPSCASKLDSKKAESSKKQKEVPVSFNPGSNNFFDLDDYVFDDDYWALQSHFDNIDLPTGIEAPIPWLPDLVQMKKNTPANPFVSSNALLGASASQTNMVDQLSTSTWASSSKKNKSSGNIHSNYTQIGSGNYFFNNSNTQIGNGTSSFPQLAMNTANPLGIDTTISEWHKSIIKNHMELNNAYLSPGMLSGTEGIYSMDSMLLGQGAAVNSPSPSPMSSKLAGSSSSMAKPANNDVMKKYESFKKFDTVVDHSDHHYARQNSAMKQPPKNWAKKIQEEWRILEKDLPDTIFVRVYESRMDLLRAVIIGAEGTPYHDGLFFFDVCFPSSYPNSPPLVHYHSGGLRINPNLYNCGKVCLSLLNTWTGGQKERWVPGTSTMLQVLVSIQGLILNMKPYFNEPGYAHSSGSVQGEKSSLQYNENTLILSLKTMVYTMNKPPKNFEDLVVGHFRNRVRDILMACKAYTEGVQVGCLVKGGVQDVDEGNNSCSPKFKNDVASYVKTLVTAFKKIGAKEAEEFLHLSNKKIPLPAAPTPTPPVIGYSPFPFNSISAYNQHW